MKGAAVTRNAPDGAIHTMFGLTYANFLVLPRTLLQSMPLEWQDKFVALMDEYEQRWWHIETEPQGGYRVQPVDLEGKFLPGIGPVPHYDRGRTLVTPERSR